MTLNIYNVISIIAIFQSAFLSAFFFQHRKGIITSNRIFGTILVIFALYVAYIFTMSMGAGTIFMKHYSIIYLMSQISFLFGQLLFFYIKSVINVEFQIHRRDALHFIPFFAAMAFLFIRTNFLEINVHWQSSFRVIGSIAVLVHILTYIVAAIILLRPKIKSFFSPIDEPRLAWLRMVLCGYIVVWLMQLHIFVAIDLWKLYNLCPYSDTLLLTVLFILFNCTVFIGLKKPEIFSFTKKYQGFDLKESDKELYKRKLLSLMEQQKIYLDPSLTLTNVSKKLLVSVPYLSRIVNESFNANFCDFINQYRIEESKRLLKQLPINNKTILAVAYESGFNSKSSFNTAFKRQTGMTPTKFVKLNS